MQSHGRHIEKRLTDGNTSNNQYGGYVAMMKKHGRQNYSGILSTAAELFDLPEDLVTGLPRLELIGSRQLYLEHHTGILSYSDTRIDANTTAGVLRIGGAELTLLAMTGEELRVGGHIFSLEWVDGAGERVIQRSVRHT